MTVSLVEEVVRVTGEFEIRTRPQWQGNESRVYEGNGSRRFAVTR